MAFIAGNSHDERTDATHTVNRKYALSPISEPRTVDTSTWQNTTDLSRNVQTTLQRTTITINYANHKSKIRQTRKGGIRGPKHAYTTHTQQAITNATHTRNARTKGTAANFYTPRQP